MGRKKKQEYLDEEAVAQATALAAHPDRPPINNEDYPHLSAEEIDAEIQRVEEEKAEKKRQRERRRRLKELKAAQEKKSQRVVPIILIITVVICLMLMFIASLNQGA